MAAVSTTLMSMSPGLERVNPVNSTASLGDLDENQKLWLVIGISMNTVLCPVLRKCIESKITLLYNTLKNTHYIHTQNKNNFLQFYGPKHYFLNYDSINNNKAKFGMNTTKYDYRILSAVDLSKVFLKPTTAQYTSFDETCDMSALLGIIINSDQFTANVQYKANEIRSDIRNPWAHCNFKEWTRQKYMSSFHTLEEFVKLLSLTNKKQTLQELKEWKMTGINFIQNTSANQRVENVRNIYVHMINLSSATTSDSDAVSKWLKTLGNIMNTRMIDLEQYCKDIENKVTSLQDLQPRPFALSDYHQIEIRSWEEQDSKFVETEVVEIIMERLKSEHTVMVTGTPGIGKSVTIHHIALLLRQTNFCTIIPCHSPQEIISLFRERDDQVFVIDDICGKCTTSDVDIDNWINSNDKVKNILEKGKTKLLSSCRLEICKEEKFKCCSSTFACNTFDLSSTYSLSPSDSLIIARQYLKEEHVDIIKSLLPNITFSPMICSLFANKNVNFSLEEFITAPFKLFRKEWNQLRCNDRTKYFVLFLCVIYNGCVDESLFRNIHKQSDMFKHLYEIFKIDHGTPRSVIKEKFESCVGSYIKKDETCYRVIHDQMFDYLCCYFGEERMSEILKYADCKLLCERTQLASLHVTKKENTILVSEVVETEYMFRVRKELEAGRIHLLLNSSQMKYSNYRNKFRNVLGSLNATFIKRSMNQVDRNQNSAFVVVCLRGYNELVTFFINNGACVNKPSTILTPLTAAARGNHTETISCLITTGAKLNQVDTYGDTALYCACLRGSLDIVKYFIKIGADVNKTVKYGGTPLYAACLKGHDTIVSFLLSTKAKVNKTTKDDDSPLYAACIGGFREIVQLLIDHGADINKSAQFRGSPLYAACSKGYLGITKMLLSKGADVNKNGHNTDTPLVAACLGGYEEIIECLIMKKANVNKGKADGRTPLHIASKIGNTSIVKLLLENGSHVDSTYGMGYTSLREACLQGHISTVQILVNNGVNLNQTTTSQETPLYVACREGFFSIVDELLNNGAKINLYNCKQETPLYVACSNNHPNIVKLILSKNVDINISNDSNETPLYVASSLGYENIVRYLIHNGADIKHGTVYGWSAFYASCSAGCDNIVQLLIEFGADVNQRSSNGWTPIGVACSEGYVRIATILLENGVSVNETNKNGETPLYVACLNQHTLMCQLLLRKGGNIAQGSKNGKTPLHIACANGFVDIAQNLIENGASIDNIDINGNTPLHLSSVEGHLNTTKVLLIKEADINGLNNDNETPLFLSSKMCHVQIVQHLLKNGAIVDIPTKEGHTALGTACFAGYSKIVSLLYKFGVNINQKDRKGRTPLCIVCSKGHYDIVKFLIEHGADLNKRNSHGHSPLHCALSADQNEIANFLLEKGAINDILEDIE